MKVANSAAQGGTKGANETVVQTRNKKFIITRATEGKAEEDLEDQNAGYDGSSISPENTVNAKEFVSSTSVQGADSEAVTTVSESEKSSKTSSNVADFQDLKEKLATLRTGQKTGAVHGSSSTLSATEVYAHGGNQHSGASKLPLPESQSAGSSTVNFSQQQHISQSLPEQSAAHQMVTQQQSTSQTAKQDQWQHSLSQEQQQQEYQPTPHPQIAQKPIPQIQQIPATPSTAGSNEGDTMQAATGQHGQLNKQTIVQMPPQAATQMHTQSQPMASQVQQPIANQVQPMTSQVQPQQIGNQVTPQSITNQIQSQPIGNQINSQPIGILVQSQPIPNQVQTQPMANQVPISQMMGSQPQPLVGHIQPVAPQHTTQPQHAGQPQQLVVQGSTQPTVSQVLSPSQHQHMNPMGQHVTYIPQGNQQMQQLLLQQQLQNYLPYSGMVVPNLYAVDPVLQMQYSRQQAFEQFLHLSFQLQQAQSMNQQHSMLAPGGGMTTWQQHPGIGTGMATSDGASSTSLGTPPQSPSTRKASTEVVVGQTAGLVQQMTDQSNSQPEATEAAPPKGENPADINHLMQALKRIHSSRKDTTTTESVPSSPASVARVQDEPQLSSSTSLPYLAEAIVPGDKVNTDVLSLDKDALSASRDNLTVDKADENRQRAQTLDPEIMKPKKKRFEVSAVSDDSIEREDKITTESTTAIIPEQSKEKIADTVVPEDCVDSGPQALNKQASTKKGRFQVTSVSHHVPENDSSTPVLEQSDERNQMVKAAMIDNGFIGPLQPNSAVSILALLLIVYGYMCMFDFGCLLHRWSYYHMSLYLCEKGPDYPVKSASYGQL